MSQKKPKKTTREKDTRKRRIKYFLAGAMLALSLLPLIFYGVYRIQFHKNIFPKISIAGVEVSGLTQTQARTKLEKRLTDYLYDISIILTYSNREWELPLTSLKPRYNPEEEVYKAFAVGRTGTPREQLTDQWQTLREPKNLKPQVVMDEEQLQVLIASIAAQIEKPAIPPKIEIVKPSSVNSSRIRVVKGESGTEVDQASLVMQIRDQFERLEDGPRMIPLRTVEVVDDEGEFSKAVQRAESLLGKSLTLTVDDPFVTQDWTLDGEAMVSFVEIGNGFNQEKLGTYLTGVSESVNRPAQNAKFTFSESAKRVEEFEPAKNGLELDKEQSRGVLTLALGELAQGGTATKAAMIVKTTRPNITMNDANNLGINELLGRGTSTYKGSIPTRVHNVALAASRINGTLVKPGETFSFNQAVGDVSGATGYQQAYIIRNGRTELGDGGGVCQDSTTVFRAALDAGLPITERKAHAYRVGYYEQDVKAGIDATVYAPSPDLKFINDTPAHLLIQAKADTPKRALTVEIYGTSDGRKSEIFNHVVWDITPPPPDVYQDDPTLKTGEVKQVDWKAGGAKAKFDYLVTRNGETIYEKTFYSTYKPWAAVFLRGTGQ